MKSSTCMQKVYMRLLSVFTLFISISSISAADITSVGIDTADSSANDLNIDTFDVYPINQDNALGAWAMGPVTQDNTSILN